MLEPEELRREIADELGACMEAYETPQHYSSQPSGLRRGQDDRLRVVGPDSSNRP